MIKNALNYLCVTAFLTFSANLHAQTRVSFEKYKTNSEVQQTLNLLQQKAISSMSNKAISSKVYPQDMLKVTGAKVVAAGKITDLRTNKVSYQEHKPEIIFTSVPSYGYVEYQFLVEGKGEIKLNYSSRKAGNQVKTLKL